MGLSGSHLLPLHRWYETCSLAYAMEPLSLQHHAPSTNGRTRAVRPATPRVLGMRAAALDTLYQPIFDVSGPRPKMLAVEGLTRGPRGSALESSDALFSHARRHGAEAEFDETAARLAVSRAGDLTAAGLDLHVNVHASSLSASYASSLLSTCWEHGLQPSQIVLEIVEHGRRVERDALREAIQHLKNLGFRIALDDIGMGQSNFLMLYLSRPEEIKIDRFFVHGVSHDPVRRAMVVAIQRMAEELEAVVVAEGVEEAEDLHALYDLGIRRVQGFLLSRPAYADDWTARNGSLEAAGLHAA